MEDTLTITGLLLGSSGLECFFVDSTSWGMFLVKLGRMMVVCGFRGPALDDAMELTEDITGRGFEFKKLGAMFGGGVEFLTFATVVCKVIGCPGR